MGERNAEGGATGSLLRGEDVEAEVEAKDVGASETTATRTLVLFWVLGVLNNASYVIMIASAKSISSGGVALVYLAAGLPGLLTKLSAPLWFDRVGYFPRLFVATVCMALSFALVGPLGFGRLGLQLGGVLLCSVQSSLGEASLLALASRYPARGRAAVSAWSSGTGFAGIFGYAWVFLCTKALRFSPAGTQTAALAALPTSFALAFSALLKGARVRPAGRRVVAGEGDGVPSSAGDADDDVDDGADRVSAPRAVEMSAWTRVGFGLSLWPVTGAIFAVYFSEYAMQSGVWASMGFPSPNGPHGAKRRDAFYLYANWLYQCGVLCSRSSGFLTTRQVPKSALWAMALAQCGLLVFFAVDAADHFWYDSSLFALCFVVGLFGGAVYVYGFRSLSATSEGALAELAMPVGAFAADAGTFASNVVGLYLQACLYDANQIQAKTAVEWSICSGGIHPAAGGGAGRPVIHQ